MVLAEVKCNDVHHQGGFPVTKVINTIQMLLYVLHLYMWSQHEPAVHPPNFSLTWKCGGNQEHLKC